MAAAFESPIFLDHSRGTTPQPSGKHPATFDAINIAVRSGRPQTGGMLRELLHELALCVIHADEAAFSARSQELALAVREAAAPTDQVVREARALISSPWFDFCARSSPIRQKLCVSLCALLRNLVQTSRSNGVAHQTFSSELSGRGHALEGLGAPAFPSHGQLSAREVEVVSLVAAGMSNKVIALRLHLSPNTIKRHLARVMDRLGVRSRAALATYYSGLQSLSDLQ